MCCSKCEWWCLARAAAWQERRCHCWGLAKALKSRCWKLCNCLRILESFVQDFRWKRGLQSGEQWKGREGQTRLSMTDSLYLSFWFAIRFLSFNLSAKIKSFLAEPGSGSAFARRLTIRIQANRRFLSIENAIRRCANRNRVVLLRTCRQIIIQNCNGHIGIVPEDNHRSPRPWFHDKLRIANVGALHKNFGSLGSKTNDLLLT